MNSSDITSKSARKTTSFPPRNKGQVLKAGGMSYRYLKTAEKLSIICEDRTSLLLKAILPYTQLSRVGISLALSSSLL